MKITNQTESGIGVIINKETTSNKPPRNQESDNEIQYVNIDTHSKFIERVFSVKNKENEDARAVVEAE